MDLVVFDLDGTLLNKSGTISPYTRDTLKHLADRGIAYTVATGRTLHGTENILQGAGFIRPQIYKNGVLIWNPAQQDYSHRQALTLDEIEHILKAVFESGISPFVFTLTPENHQVIYHPSKLNAVEQSLVNDFMSVNGMTLEPLANLPPEALITNISALGIPSGIEKIVTEVENEEHLVAYAGQALEGDSLRWLDVHHTDGSKGGAVDLLRRQLGAKRVLCFGDSDNDLSMFETADESYAPANAKEHVLAAADAIIGHHDEEGVARFLRERFNLPTG